MAIMNRYKTGIFGIDRARRLCKEHYEIDLEANITIAPFIGDLWKQLIRCGRLSKKQVSAAKRCIKRYEELKKEWAAKEKLSMESGVSCPEGRVTITGVVVSLKTVENDFTKSEKMLVKSDEGWRVFGSMPAALEGITKGQRVEFTARVKPKDPLFGFYSRPTKARVIDLESGNEK